LAPEALLSCHRLSRELRPNGSCLRIDGARSEYLSGSFRPKAELAAPKLLAVMQPFEGESYELEGCAFESAAETWLTAALRFLRS
jgi:hypothetical protein